MGTPRRPAKTTTRDPLYEERVAIEGPALSTWEEHARAQGRTMRLHGGLILRFFFTLIRKLPPRLRERIYYYVFHPEDISAEDIAAVLRVLESKG